MKLEMIGSDQSSQVFVLEIRKVADYILSSELATIASEVV
jgi:hypothetical protein